AIELDKNKEEIKVNGADLVYSDGSRVYDNYKAESQTISTPKGGEYKIVLSDGTKVWLNAATVLKYPTSFRERTERRVKLVSGEAYFEVAKDPKHPFIVTSRNQELTVIGTHFNINTYTKTVKTVLLEGAVKLKSINSIDSISLRPGEESGYHGNGFQKQEADINLTIAWKNGKIKFRNADLKSILDEAERWYNIKVEYEGKIPNIHLTGGMSRKSSLATLLKLLQMSGVPFSLSDEQNITTLKIRS
ncbi:MAG: FecR family protein, partial [Pedobacter sp.]